MPDLPSDLPSGGGVLGPSMGSGVVSSGSASFGGVVQGSGGEGGTLVTSNNRSRAPVNTDSFSRTIRLNVPAERVVANVQGLDILTGTLVGVTVGLCGTALPAVTLQHMVSTDGLTFLRLGGTTDVTAEGAFSVTVSGWPLYALQVSTVAGSAAYARITLNAKANS